MTAAWTPFGSGPLHLVERGSGPRLVLVHGVAGSYMVWDELAPLLETTFTLTAVDLLGYGRSPRPEDCAYTPAEHAEALRATLHSAGLAHPYRMVGLSMGVNLVLEFARRWPDEVGEMVGTGLPYYPDEATARAALRHNGWIRLTLQHPRVAALATPLVWAVARRLAWLFPSGRALYPPAMAADALRASYRAFRSSLFACMIDLRQDELLAASSALRRLFVQGRDDSWCSPGVVADLLADYPDSTLRVLEGPHNLAVAEPTATAAVLQDHLAPAPGRQPG